MNDLIQELEETARWIEERAEILAALKVRGETADIVRAEVARYRGRAALIRLTAQNAKAGAL